MSRRVAPQHPIRDRRSGVVGDANPERKSRRRGSWRDGQAGSDAVSLLQGQFPQGGGDVGWAQAVTGAALCNAAITSR